MESELAYGIGMTNCVNGRYFPTCEYDYFSYSDVKADTKRLQKKHNLMDAYIYKTRRGYRVIYWYDLFDTQEQTLQILYDSSSDTEFKKVSSKLPFTTIRSNGKYKRDNIYLVNVIKTKRSPNHRTKSIMDAVIRFRDSMNGAKIIPNKYLLD
jgi:hypothetical protein